MNNKFLPKVWKKNEENLGLSCNDFTLHTHPHEKPVFWIPLLTRILLHRILFPDMCLTYVNNICTLYACTVNVNYTHMNLYSLFGPRTLDPFLSLFITQFLSCCSFRTKRPRDTLEYPKWTHTTTTNHHKIKKTTIKIPSKHHKTHNKNPGYNATFSALFCLQINAPTIFRTRSPFAWHLHVTFGCFVFRLGGRFAEAIFCIILEMTRKFRKKGEELFF